ncbi:RNA 2',3'-cyclic phosphodiesterase [Acidovorax sp. LjRoot74]|uniref:2'-5' RNA ligase family protein n=1 Tax=Acidovorax sp. LjRoot74 TaxID=3342337 RepID=UPI003ED0A703
MLQRHDLYFFVCPPRHVAERAFGLLNGLELTPCPWRAAPMPAARLHITLEKLGQFRGAIPPDTVDKALAAANYVAFEPFDVAFDRVEYSGGVDGCGMAWLTGRSWGLRGIRGLEHTLAHAMLRAGFPESQIRTHFHPHVTLNYRHEPFDWCAVAPLAWRVNQFMLVDSWYGLGRHDLLGCWSLSPRQLPLPW